MDFADFIAGTSPDAFVEIEKKLVDCIRSGGTLMLSPEEVRLLLVSLIVGSASENCLISLGLSDAIFQMSSSEVEARMDQALPEWRTGGRLS